VSLRGQKALFKAEVGKIKHYSKMSVDWNVESRTEAQNRARKPKTSAFKRILGLGVISRFLEVEETSPPLCNLLFSS